MAKKKFYVDVDLQGNQLLSVVAEVLASAPSNPKPGQFYFDSTLKRLRYYTDATTGWVNGTPLSAANKNPDVAGSFGVYHSTDNDVFLFRNIKAKTSKIDIRLSGNGEIEIDANISKSDVGLANVTNDAQVKRSEMGAVNGVATLGADGKVPSTQLPSYVDDVVEFAAQIPTKTGMTVGNLYYITGTKLLCSATSATAGTDITPEVGKIYVDLQTAKTYRWGGTDLVVISETLALGETEFSAYRGDRGKEAFDHSQNAAGMAVPHVSDADRSNWNNKQEKNITITAPTVSDIQATAGDYTIRNLFQKLVDNIKALYDRFNVSNGHDHNGTNSKKIDYASLTGTGSIVKKYVSAALTGASGTITAATHGCGTTPQVIFVQNGEHIELAWTINASGDIAWGSNISFVAGDVLKAIVNGI